MTTKKNGERGERILKDQKLTLTQIQELFQENLKFGWQKNAVTLIKKNQLIDHSFYGVRVRG